MVVVVVGLNMVSHHQKHAPPHTHSHSPSLVYSLVFSFLALVQAPFFFLLKYTRRLLRLGRPALFGLVWFGPVWHRPALFGSGLAWTGLVRSISSLI